MDLKNSILCAERGRWLWLERRCCALHLTKLRSRQGGSFKRSANVVWYSDVEVVGRAGELEICEELE